MKNKEIEIGVEDTETPVKYRIIKSYGKNEVVLEVGRPSDPPRVYLDEKQIDIFIGLLKDAKKRLKEI